MGSFFFHQKKIDCIVFFPIWVDALGQVESIDNISTILIWVRCTKWCWMDILKVCDIHLILDSPSGFPIKLGSANSTWPSPSSWSSRNTRRSSQEMTTHLRRDHAQHLKRRLGRWPAEISPTCGTRWLSKQIVVGGFIKYHSYGYHEICPINSHQYDSNSNIF